MIDENRGVLDDRAVKELINHFNELQDKEPQEFIAGLRENELILVSLRDVLMDVPRQERSPDQKKRLDKINTALSLVISGIPGIRVGKEETQGCDGIAENAVAPAEYRVTLPNRIGLRKIDIRMRKQGRTLHC